MKKQQKQKRFKNHFDKFPPILREMVQKATFPLIWEYGDYDCWEPLTTGFLWFDNRCFSDYDFWEAVNEDAIHHKLWES